MQVTFTSLPYMNLLIQSNSGILVEFMLIFNFTAIFTVHDEYALQPYQMILNSCSCISYYLRFFSMNLTKYDEKPMDSKILTKTVKPYLPSNRHNHT